MKGIENEAKLQYNQNNDQVTEILKQEYQKF